MTTLIEGARQGWRRIATAGGGRRSLEVAAGARPAAPIREVCLVGDPDRRYRHRPEVAAGLRVAGEGA